MSSRTFITLASAVLATVSHVGADILSCADVECPITPGGTSATCTVVDNTFNAVGVVGLDTTVDGLQGISWTKAVSADDDGSERTFRQNYYLGTPQDFDFGGSTACALFFTKVSDRVKFGEGDTRNSEGTCRDAMTDACIDALLERAKNVDFEGLAGTAACEKLQQDFSDNLDGACTAFAQASSWADITGKALSGEDAPEPISGQQNSTSTCWPVLPKSHDLTLIESTNATGDFDASTLIKHFFSITPVLTVFFPGNGTGPVTQKEAQLSCLKTIDLSTAQEDTMNSGDENAAGRLLGSKAAVWVGLMSAAFAVALG